MSEEQTSTVGERALEAARLNNIRRDPQLTENERKRFVLDALAKVLREGEDGNTNTSLCIHDLQRDANKLGNKVPCESDAGIIAALAEQRVHAKFREHFPQNVACEYQCHCQYGYELDWSRAYTTPVHAPK